MPTLSDNKQELTVENDKVSANFAARTDDFYRLGLQQALVRALKKLGWQSATEVQQKAIPLALEGKDIIVSARTGSGKTATFVLPLLNRLLAEKKPKSGTRGLILLPTRELAIQTQRVFQALATYTWIKSGLLIGGEPFKYQIATLRRNPEVLIATPGRLVEHIEKGHALLSELEMLVLDEADRMLDMGFAEAMQMIARVCHADRQNLMFSATLHHKDFNRIKATLNHPVRIQIDRLSHGHGDIIQQCVLADDDKHKENLVVALITEEQSSRSLVFCNTRIQAERLSHVLRYKKLKAAYIHGEVTQSVRKQIMSRFLDNRLQVLVATDLAARGLDIKEIDLVINFTVPHSGDEYVHRIGRTGRAGQSGKAITLVASAEWHRRSAIERYLKVRLVPRKVKGLAALYKGPKKVKKSGKAASSKKRTPSAKKQAGKKRTGKPSG